MNNRLSFAQILQKKQSTANQPLSYQQSPSIPTIPSISQSRISHTSNRSSNPTSMRVSKVNTNIMNNISPYSRSKSMDISLYQMMEQFINNPNQLQDNFILSFDQSQGSNQFQYQYENENEDGNDFQVGVNPLDSFIMSQSKACGKNKGGICRQQPHGIQPLHTTNKIYQGSSRIAIHHAKTTNQQLGNADNILNLSKNPHKQQLKTSQHHHHHHAQRTSHIISSKVQQNNQKPSIININNKIIQSQNYPNICHQNKKNQNIHDLANLAVANQNVGYLGKGVNIVGVPRIERSEGVDVGDTRKLSRYQVNYLQSQRKQEPKQENDFNKQPPILQQSQSQQDASRKKLIISKVKSQTDQAKKEVVLLKSQFTKKQSQEEEYLLAQIPNPCSSMLSSHDRRIQQAKKQISEYLQIRQKPNQNLHKPKPLKSPPQQPDQPLLISMHQQQPQYIPTNPQSQPAAYSFSTNMPFPSSCTPDHQNFQPKTRKQMKQICEEQMEKENQEMLACIQYTQSEVDLVEDLGEMEAYKKNLEICQSIPQRTLKLDEQPRQQYTLQKYIPNHTLPQQQQKPYPQAKKQQEQPSQVYEQSQMIEKVPVQPSSSNSNSFGRRNSNEQENSEQNNVNISNHPTLQPKISNQSKDDASMELSDGYRCREVQVGEKKVPFHDVSSIDIHISDLDIDGGSQNNSQYNQSSQKVNQQPQTIPILPPTLNTSDFQSIQNISIPSSKPSQPFSHNLEPTPSKTSNQSNLHLRELQIEKASSKPPIETSINSNQSLHKNVHTHGFIYKMRVHSRNNSFTSNYDSSLHGSQAANRRSFCGSSQASVYLQDGQSFQQHNMPNEVIEVRMDKFNKVGGHRVATQPEYVHNIQEQSSDSSYLEQLNPHQPLIQNMQESTSSIPTQSALEPIPINPNIEIQIQSASTFKNKQPDFDEGPQNKNQQVCSKNVQTETQVQMDQTKAQAQDENQNQQKTPQAIQKTTQNQPQPQNSSSLSIPTLQTLQTLTQPQPEPIVSSSSQEQQQDDQISQNILENNYKQNGTQNVKIQIQVQMASKVEENVQSANQENFIGGQSEIYRGKQLQCLSVMDQNLGKRNQGDEDKDIGGNSEGKFRLGGEMGGEVNGVAEGCVQSVTLTQLIAQQLPQINIQNPIQTHPKKEIASPQKPQPQSQPHHDTATITSQQPQIPEIPQISNTNKQQKQSIKTNKDDQPFQFDLDF